jgi:hypothetical protein
MHLFKHETHGSHLMNDNLIGQQFLTWGTRTPKGTRALQGGTQNVTFTDIFPLGVREYQKVKNICYT